MNRSVWCLLFLLLLSGCASLPQVVAVPAEESETAQRAFQIFSREQCPHDLDADVTISFDNFLSKGTIKGYLQAMSPAFLRFEGVNPLGLTETVLASDGKGFTFLVVRQRKGYVGRLDAGEIRRYLSPQVAASFSFDWLLGRASRMAEAGFLGRNRELTGYWFSVPDGTELSKERILFDPSERVIRQRLLLDQDNDVVVAITYQYSESTGSLALKEENPDGCRLPGTLVVSSPGNGSIALTFQERYPSGAQTLRQFMVSIPQDFERIVIK